MAWAKGRGVRLEIANTFGTAQAVTEVSEANPGVATFSAAFPSDNVVGYFTTATGMPRLAGQVCIANELTATTAELVDIDTTSYGNYTAGSFIPVQTWLTLSNATDYNKSGGEAPSQDVSTLLDEVGQAEAGMLAPETLTITMRGETVSNAALAKVRSEARNGGYIIGRITLKDGSKRIFRGQPSLPTESLGTGGIAQQTFNVVLKGLWIEAAA